MHINGNIINEKCNNLKAKIKTNSPVVLKTDHFEDNLMHING